MVAEKNGISSISTNHLKNIFVDILETCAWLNKKQLVSSTESPCLTTTSCNRTQLHRQTHKFCLSLLQFAWISCYWPHQWKYSFKNMENKSSCVVMKLLICCIICLVFYWSHCCCLMNFLSTRSKLLFLNERNDILPRCLNLWCWPSNSEAGGNLSFSFFQKDVIHGYTKTKVTSFFVLFSCARRTPPPYKKHFKIIDTL